MHIELINIIDNSVNNLTNFENVFNNKIKDESENIYYYSFEILNKTKLFLFETKKLLEQISDLFEDNINLEILYEYLGMFKRINDDVIVCY